MLYQYMIHIPLTYNDGSPIEPEKLAEFIIEIEDRFGGYTRSRSNWDGYWKEEVQENGEQRIIEYRDTIMLLIIDGSEEIKAELQYLAGTYANHLRQKKIYIKYHLIEEL